MSLGICGQRRPGPACASTQSDQGPYCPQTESLDTTEEQRPRWYFAHAQDDLILCIFGMFEGTFMVDAVHMQIATAKIRLHIHTVWLDPSRFIYNLYNTQ